MFARFGGNWNNGSNAGLSYWNLNNSSGDTNLNIGRQTLIGKYLIFAPYSPHRLVKIQADKEHGLVGYSKHHEANKKVIL